MWQNFLHQISDVTHFELDSLVGSVRPDESAPPPLLDPVEQSGSICVLADRETRPNLPTEAMTTAWLKRNAKATFSVYESRNVRVQIHRQRPGPACYGLAAIQGSQPLSRYGDSTCAESYPRYCPRRPCNETSCGFHRFEPVVWNGVATVPGNVTYPTRNFATLGPFLRLINPAFLPF